MRRFLAFVFALLLLASGLILFAAHNSPVNECESGRIKCGKGTTVIGGNLPDGSTVGDGTVIYNPPGGITGGVAVGNGAKVGE